MRQQVNLLDPALIPRREAFPAFMILLLPLLVLAALTAWYGYARWELGEVRRELTKLAGQESVLITQLARMVEQFPRLEKDPRLEARLQELTDEKGLKLRVLETLKGRTLTNTEGFARHLDAIARQWVEGTWMESLEIDGAGERLRLTGYAVAAALPARLVTSLGEAPPLHGTSFRTFRITQPDDAERPLYFELDTLRVAPPEEQPGGREAAGSSPRQATTGGTG